MMFREWLFVTCYLSNVPPNTYDLSFNQRLGKSLCGYYTNDPTESRLQSVRYVLIDQAVVKGEREALYYSRGQGGLFYSALAAEEEKDAKERGEIPPVENGDSEEELMKEVRLREAERDSSRKARVKGGVGSSWRLSSP
jgi:hypothetical protein